MTPLPPYEHLDPDPLHVQDEEERARIVDFLTRAMRGGVTPDDGASKTWTYTPPDYDDRPRPSRAVIGWLLVSLAVVLLVTVSVALFLRWFGA